MPPVLTSTDPLQAHLTDTERLLDRRQGDVLDGDSYRLREAQGQVRK